MRRSVAILDKGRWGRVGSAGSKTGRGTLTSWRSGRMERGSHQGWARGAMTSCAEDGASGSWAGPPGNRGGEATIWTRTQQQQASRDTRGHHTQQQDPFGGHLLWEVRRRFGGAEGTERFDAGPRFMRMKHWWRV